MAQGLILDIPEEEQEQPSRIEMRQAPDRGLVLEFPPEPVEPKYESFGKSLLEGAKTTAGQILEIPQQIADVIYPKQPPGQPGGQLAVDESQRRVVKEPPAEPREEVISAAPEREQSLWERFARVFGGYGEGAEKQRIGREGAKTTLALTAAERGETPYEFKRRGGAPSEIPEQAAYGMAQAMTLGTGKLFKEAVGGEIPEAETSAGAVARGAGELVGFLTGVPVAIGARVEAAVLERFLAPLIAGGGKYRLLAAAIAREMGTLAAATGVAETGEALSQTSIADAARVELKAAGKGAITGAVFGGVTGVLPTNDLATRAARMGIGMALNDESQGAHPFDDRSLTQKAFDYGIAAFFLFHGRETPMVMGQVYREAKAKRLTPDEAFKLIIEDARKKSTEAEFNRLVSIFRRRGQDPETAKKSAAQAILQREAGQTAARRGPEEPAPAPEPETRPSGEEVTPRPGDVSAEAEPDTGPYRATPAPEAPPAVLEMPPSGPPEAPGRAEAPKPGPEPAPAPEAAPAPPGRDVAALQRMVEDAGGSWVGIQEVPEKIAKRLGIDTQMIAFNEPVSGSTINIPVNEATPEAIRQRLEAKRQAFEAARPPAERPRAPEQLPTTPEPVEAKPLAEEPTVPQRAILDVAKGAGHSGEAVTEAGTKVPFRYAIVEAGDLRTSRDPGYPQQFQPRQVGTRAAYEAQEHAIAGQLDPERLGESRLASEGSPLVDAQGNVISGNRRTEALRKAHSGSARYATRREAYQSWLESNAPRFGIPREDFRGAKAPVLVRVITDPGLNLRELAVQANVPAVSAMSASELAGIDAGNMTPRVMNLFQPSEAGQINTPQNRDFIREFMELVP